MGLRDNLTENALWMTISDAVKGILGFVVLLLVIKLGGIAVYGTYKAIISLSSVMAIFSNFGLHTALLKHLVSKDKSRFFSAALIFRLLSNLALILVVIAMLGTLEELTGINQWILEVAATLTIFGILPLFRSLFTASLSMFEYFRVTILGYLLMMLLVAGFLTLGLGVYGLVLAYAIHNTLILALLFLKSLRVVGFSVPSIKHIRYLLSLGLSVWIPLVFNVVGRYSAEIFLFAFSGSIQTGKYSVAFAIMTLVLMPLSPVAQLLIPNLERYPEGERSRVLTKVTEIEYEILAPIVGILMLISDELMAFLSADGLLLRVLLLSTVFVPLMKANSICLIRGERKTVITIRGMMVNSVKLVLYYLLTPLWGGVGAALSYTMGELTRGPLELYLIRRHGITMNWVKISALIALGLVPFLLHPLGYHVHLATVYASLTLLLYRLLPREDKDLLRVVITTPIRVLQGRG